MPKAVEVPADSLVLEGLRRRGQFLISGILWIAASGLLVLFSGWTVIVYHYALAFAERTRTSMGLAAPAHGRDWFLLAFLAAGPALALIGAVLFIGWYRRIWTKRIQIVWPERPERSRYSRWRPLPIRANPQQRERRKEYLTALLQSDARLGVACPSPADGYEASARALLLEMER